jgi:hypothetical protein
MVSASVNKKLPLKILRYFRRWLHFVTASVNVWTMSCKIIFVVVRPWFLGSHVFEGERVRNEEDGERWRQAGLVRVRRNKVDSPSTGTTESASVRTPPSSTTFSTVTMTSLLASPNFPLHN